LYKLKTLNKSLDISFVLGNFCPKLSFNIFWISSKTLLFGIDKSKAFICSTVIGSLLKKLLWFFPSKPFIALLNFKSIGLPIASVTFFVDCLSSINFLLVSTLLVWIVSGVASKANSSAKVSANASFLVPFVDAPTSLPKKFFSFQK
jgi:hypothetical protein